MYVKIDISSSSLLMHKKMMMARLINSLFQSVYDFILEF